MSDVFSVSRALQQAADRMSRGDLDGAVELLRRVLAQEPDQVEAHALLSLCLCDLGQLGPAQAEAEAALAADASEPMAHAAMGSVLLADRKLDAAAKHFETALELDPLNSYHHLRFAHVELARGRPRRYILERGLELSPDDSDILAALAEERLDVRDLEEARNFATDALRNDPQCHDALLAMARLLLLEGEVEEARRVVVSALREYPSREALGLLVQVRARKSRVLGLWMRWVLWSESLGRDRTIAVLVGMFVVYRLIAQIALDLGFPLFAVVVRYAWLAFVAYTWIGPPLFARMLRNELADVQLDDDY